MSLELPVADINFHFIEYHFLFERNNKSSIAFLQSNNCVQADIFFLTLIIDHLASSVTIT